MNGKSAQRALVLCPHPDDESLGCGGTIKLMSSAGGEVDVLYMTRGENGILPGAANSPAARQRLAARRESEARAACRLLGARHVSFLDGCDGMLASQPELSARIGRTLAIHDYRSVFCPWPHDAHCDHMATYAMLHEALEQYPENIDVWLYEVWSPLPHNMCLSIDASIDAKMEAFRAHESQAGLLNYAEAFHGLARYRSLFCPPATYAEAFFNCDRLTLLRHQDIPWPPLRLRTAATAARFKQPCASAPPALQAPH